MDLSRSLAALPLWVSGPLLVGLTTLLAVFGPILVRRFVRAERLAAIAYDPEGQRGGALPTEMLNQLDQVTQIRRWRFELASGAAPGVVWFVLLTGAVVTITFTFFFGTEDLAAQVLMTGMLALMMFMGLFVVVTIEPAWLSTTVEFMHGLRADAAASGSARPRLGGCAATATSRRDDRALCRRHAEGG
jgi:hypothetical protein